MGARVRERRGLRGRGRWGIGVVMSDDWRERFLRGQVIPALPLALGEDGRWSERHERALVRYYAAAGAGGLAVGVHSTQFAIRDARYGLFEPVLALAAETMAAAGVGMVRIAGACGGTVQAVREAEVAAGLGYDAVLLSPGGWGGESEGAFLAHVRAVAEVRPVIGFYLQTAVGGRVFSAGFWREMVEISGVAGIKIAPFNRYQTMDVVRAVTESGREDVGLYTGNDDNIIGDLLTPWPGGRRIAGGLLGQWGVWTRRAVEMFEEIREVRGEGAYVAEWLMKNAALTDANAAVFDAANGFRGCIPGILEVLRRQGLVPSVRCLDEEEVLSRGQSEELDRVMASYPWLTDDVFVAEHLDEWLS